MKRFAELALVVAVVAGLVYWCRIEGKTFKDPGDLDNQTMMIVRLKVEMP